MKTYILIFFVVLAALLTGCATTDETSQLRRSIGSLESELLQLRQETDTKLSKMSKENEAMSKQVVNMYSLMESRDDKIKGLMGKIDELEYQLRAYWAETKTALAASKKPDDKPSRPDNTGAKTRSERSLMENTKICTKMPLRHFRKAGMKKL